MDALAQPWVNARVAHLLAVRRMTPVEVGSYWEEGHETDQDSPLMHTQKVETLEPFSSHVIPMRMMEMYLGEHLNIMVQALHAQDGTLPPGITMQNTYTELRKGSKKAVVVVRNKHSLPPDSPEEDPCGKGNGHATGTRYPQAWESTSSG